MNWFKKFWKALSEPAPKIEKTGQPLKIEAKDEPGRVNPFGEIEPVSGFSTTFTPQALQVLALARKEAHRFNHNFVGTDDVLLGLITLGQGTAVAVLQKMGLDLETVRNEVEKQVGTGPDQKMIGNIPYTPRVNKVFYLAKCEAENLNHRYIGTEHILLGLLREGDGVAARILRSLDVDIEQTRVAILKELDPNFSSEPSEAKGNSTSKKPGAMLQKPEMSNSEPINASKRYDVYCSERNQEVVYRNALFKGIKRLFQTREYDFASEFVELEQANGQTIFLSRHSIIKFHEPGTAPAGKKIPGIGSDSPSASANPQP